MPPSQPEKSLTVGDVARRLGLTRHRVYQLLGEDKFPRAVRIGEAEWIWQIPEGDVDAYKASRSATPADEEAES